jgi:hypothetical protein
MRVTRWFISISAVAALAAGGVAAGCSSSSSSGPSGSGGQDASTEAAPSGDGEACFVDASLAAFAESDAAGSTCAACAQTSCAPGIKQCESDCICSGFFSCLADAGVSATGQGANSGAAVAACVPSGFTSESQLLNNGGISAIYECLTVTCATPCGPLVPTVDGGEAGTTEDAGAPADGGDAATGD